MTVTKDLDGTSFEVRLESRMSLMRTMGAKLHPKVSEGRLPLESNPEYESGAGR
jgi:hypothetical protein